MNHWKARRLLSALPDGLLAADLEASVLAHAARCRRCHKALRELELSEELLRGIPQTLLPREWSRAAESRLAALASWSSEPAVSVQDRMALRALATTAAMVALLFMLSVGPWSVVQNETRASAWLLRSAERQSTFVTAAFEPPAGRATN